MIVIIAVPRNARDLERSEGDDCVSPAGSPGSDPGGTGFSVNARSLRC